MDKETPLIKIAIRLHSFAKNNAYPQEDSTKFFELLELFDDLETILREERFIK